MKVRKRDGRLEPFDQMKIANAINKAAESVGFKEELLSEELASVVTLFLEKEFSSEGIAPITEIQDMMERVLMETGHAEIARAFILFRERRERMKKIIEVREADPENTIPGRVEVDSGARDTISSWSKGRIISALMMEGGLPVELASEIASEVEERVFQSGLTRISSSLIRELVDNELFNRGLSGRLLSQSLLGVPGYDVRRLVESDGEGQSLKEVDEKVAGSILRKYALREIFNPEETEAHLRGDTRIDGLERPSAYLGLKVDPVLLPAPFGGAKLSLPYLAPCVRFLERFVFRAVHVDAMDAVLLAYTSRGTTPEEFAEILMTALASGPVSMQGLIRSPVIQISRNLTDNRARILRSAKIQGRAAHRFMDTAVVAFMEVALRLGREVAVPLIHLNLAGSRLPEEELLSRAVLLESAGRLSMKVVPGCPSHMAAITPLVGGIVLDLKNCIQKGGEYPEEAISADLQSHLAMAAAAMHSKNRFMRRLHRKGRGPKAAIRRYLGGDGETVGPGIFHLVPSALLRVKGNLGSRRTHNTGSGKEEPPWSLARVVRDFMREEGKKSGQLIRLAAPWTGVDFPSYQQPVQNPEDAVRYALEWSRYVDLDPLPPYFKEDAGERVELIRLIVEGMLERDHVP